MLNKTIKNNKILKNEFTIEKLNFNSTSNYNDKFDVKKTKKIEKKNCSF